MPEADPDLTDADARALVRDGYDAIADRYTELVNGVDEHDLRGERIAHLLAMLAPRSRVLELGCGGGLPVAKATVDAGHEYLGFDVSPRQIEVATANVPGARFVVADVLDLQLDDASFDAVVMLYAITHVPRDRWSDLFVAVRRWLTADGVLLLTTTHRSSPGWLEEDFLGLGATSWTNAHDRETTLGLLDAAGFDVIEAETRLETSLDPEGWVWIVARAKP